MTPTYRKSGNNYLPAIKHKDGRVEIIYGDPLVDILTAKKYARLEIHARRIAKFHRD